MELGERDPALSWRVIRETELHRETETAAAVASILEQHAWESAALARRDIAPRIFLGSQRRSLFYFNESDDLLFAFCYVGTGEDLPALAEELSAYCQQRELIPHVMCDVPLRQVGTETYGAVPFGVMQRLPDLKSFTLKGKAMRRLRYLVQRFRGRGDCLTKEVRCGGDPSCGSGHRGSHGCLVCRQVHGQSLHQLGAKRCPGGNLAVGSSNLPDLPRRPARERHHHYGHAQWKRLFDGSRVLSGRHAFGWLGSGHQLHLGVAHD